MIRLFLPPEKLASKQITIIGEQARYLSSVHRIKPGEQLIIFDGLGNRYICKILQSRKKEVIVEQIKKEPYSAESPITITLAQGIAKGNKMDLIIQKSTELGVKKIIPLITKRTQIRHTDKIDRWRKIALSASQQSGRGKIPDVTEPVNFKEFINRQTCLPSPSFSKDNPPSPPFDKGGLGGLLGIILSEEEKEQNLKKILNTFQDTTKIILLVGPEGGFSKEEISTAIQKGFISVSLGPRILRTETAPITAISIIQYELGDMG